MTIISDPKKTALILIDLQQGILAYDTHPQSSDRILEQGHRLATQFREAGATVVLVNVGWHRDMKDVPPGLTDIAPKRPAGGLPQGWMALADDLAQPGDLLITKRQWGAFSGTELDHQLRRRGTDTLVVAGIATQMGVESTVRHGWELGYNMIVVEDACASPSAEAHDMSMTQIFPHIARVVQTSGLQLSV